MDEFEDETQDSESKLRDKFATGKFVRPRRRDIISETDPDQIDEPTQKIILFPTEKSQAEPNDDSSITGKLPPLVLDPSQLSNQEPKQAPLQSRAVEPPPSNDDFDPYDLAEEDSFDNPLLNLPKVKDLPKDFFEEGELDELDSAPRPISKNIPPPAPVDLMKFLKDDNKEEKKIAQLMKELNEKADYYADHMFLESELEDTEELERLERLIPGTDFEEGKRVVVAPSRQKADPKRKKNLPPDLDPKVLGRKLQSGLKFMKIRRLFLGLLVVLSYIITLFPDFLGEQLTEMATLQNQIAGLAVLLVVGMVSTGDLLFKGFQRSLHLKLGMDSLCLFSGIFCLLDCFLQATSENPRGQLPFVSLLLMNYFLLLYGEEEKRRAHRKACQVVALISEPYLLTLEPHKWNGKSAYTKSSAKATGFTSQLQQDDGTQIVFAFTCPFFLMLSFFTALKLGTNTEDFVWAFSALLVVSSPLGAGFIYGRSAHKVAKRLDRMRSALAGWTGIAEIGRQCIICDSDLFPAGAVTGNGVCVFKGYNERKILAYTSALVLEGELGCGRWFQEMMVVRNLTPPKIKKVAYHEAGGISAEIGSDSVLVGSADFMELMHIPVPEGLFVTNAIFCSINKHIAGYFIVDYNLPEPVAHSIESLLLERIRPVLATRDFALTPQMLKRRFDLNTGRMDFPSILRRQELSRTDRPKEGRLTAMLSREGLEPVSDCVIAAGRLRRTVYGGIAWTLGSTVLGFALVSYLVQASSYNALSPTNLLIYMVLAMMPLWVMTDLPQRF